MGRRAAQAVPSVQGRARANSPGRAPRECGPRPAPGGRPSWSAPRAMVCELYCSSIRRPTCCTPVDRRLHVRDLACPPAATPLFEGEGTVLDCEQVGATLPDLRCARPRGGVRAEHAVSAPPGVRGGARGAVAGDEHDGPQSSAQAFLRNQRHPGHVLVPAVQRDAAPLGRHGSHRCDRALLARSQLEEDAQVETRTPCRPSTSSSMASWVWGGWATAR